jgi:hypothetical protein
MTFELEVDLCSVLEPALAGLLLPSIPSGEVRSIPQRSVGTVIPDFILVHAKESARDAQSAQLTVFEASVVAALLRRQPLRKETLARHLYTRSERVGSALTTLRRQGIVRLLPRGSYALAHPGWSDGLHVVAVEAKLRRWREALAQADRYKSFAHETYVALPAQVISASKELRQQARASGVGILSVRGQEVDLAQNARRLRVVSAEFVWLASRLLSVKPASGPVSPARATGAADNFHMRQAILPDD